MRRTILLWMMVLSMVLSFSHVVAQHEVGIISFQPKIGFNISSLTDIPDTETGLVAGLECEHQVFEPISLSWGALYSLQGSESYGLKLEYLIVPFLVNFYPVKDLAFKFGLQPGFCLSSWRDIPSGWNIRRIENNTLDLSFPIGLSYEYCHFKIDARYLFGVTKVFKNYDHQNRVWQFSLAYTL